MKQKTNSQALLQCRSPKERSVRRKRATRLPSSNKHIGNCPSAKMEQKGGQSAAMSQRLHCLLHGGRALLHSSPRKIPSSIDCQNG